jgi:hypothetical protein
MVSQPCSTARLQGGGCVSYEVRTRSEVRERLDGLERECGIDSVADIRRAHGSYHHHIGVAGEAGALALHADAAPGQLAADYDALATALSGINEQIGVVEELILDAGPLAHETMRDGHGPIAHAMREAFRHYADDGMVRALTLYRDELRNLGMAIRNTMTLYQRTDSDLVHYLNGAGGRHA